MLAGEDRDAIAAYLKAVPPQDSATDAGRGVTGAAGWPNVAGRHRGTRRVKVIVLGAGVIGVTTAYYLARGGRRGAGARPPAGARHGDELRQRRRALLRHDLALGGAGHPDEGGEVALHAAPAALHLADGRSGDVGLGRPDARRTATRRPTG